MDDEPEEEFEWNRLTELQRRNTLCLPHQKTSYPVEIQMRPLKEISEKKLQKVKTNRVCTTCDVLRFQKNQ